jgi:hypothetical protein
VAHRTPAVQLKILKCSVDGEGSRRFVPKTDLDRVHGLITSTDPASHQGTTAEEGFQLARKGSTTTEEHPRRHVMAFVRQAVYARDDNRCVECGQPEGLVLDHLVPVDNGGSDTMSNLRVVCRTCLQPKP